MSLEIEYVAWRPKALTAGEAEAIQLLVRQYSVDHLIAERERTGEGPDWSSFQIYAPADHTFPEVIFQGMTLLPESSEETIWLGLEHWCALLARIRRILPDANWQVYMANQMILWDEELQEYDLINS